MKEFPYGPAPLAILVLALISGGWLWIGSAAESHDRPKPDLVFAIFAPEHVELYNKIIPQFEEKYHVRVQFQLVDWAALTDRMESALQVGAPVPDMAEIPDLGIFTKGPLEDVGLMDLTDLVKSNGLFDSVVRARFEKWSSRGHVFALPHDVHPMMLAYRSDIVKSLGIDVSQLTTWDEFARVGRKVVSDSRGPDGLPMRYMLDLMSTGGDDLRFLNLQRGCAAFDSAGHVTFDDPRTVDTICWYVKQVQGPGQISFDCGGGQALAQSMYSGFVLFYFCPDWRTRDFEMNMPAMSGKLGLMPLPAWEPGGRRTTTWGGTGLCITKQCQNQDLAWKLAMFLYYNTAQLGPRFKLLNILPPLKESWTLPEMNEPREYWSGIRLGQVYAQLAPDVPAEPSSPYMGLANDKLGEAYLNVLEYYKKHGDDGLRDFARQAVHQSAEDVRRTISQNVFLRDESAVNQ